MSFYFELKLTPSQISMLMYFAKASKGANPKPMPKGTYSTSAVTLVKEGLLKVIKDEKGQEPTKWIVTKKGYLACELITEEVKTLKLPRNVPKYLYWYDLPKDATQARGIGGSEPEGEIIKHNQ